MSLKATSICSYSSSNDTSVLREFKARSLFRVSIPKAHRLKALPSVVCSTTFGQKRCSFTEDPDLIIHQQLGPFHQLPASQNPRTNIFCPEGPSRGVGAVVGTVGLGTHWRQGRPLRREGPLLVFVKRTSARRNGFLTQFNLVYQEETISLFRLSKEAARSTLQERGYSSMDNYPALPIRPK